MKKSLVLTLALVFVLGIAGTAFANPYSDVPAGHWAYKAVNDLTKAGIVEGHNGKYYGNQTLTRYEAAALTARALAKADKADAAQKATIDKLAVEFSKELNDLGVRVAKLEKNASNVKWTGNARFRYRSTDTNDVNTQNSQQLRTRIIASGTVNDDMTYVARFENVEDFRTSGTQDGVKVTEGYLSSKMGQDARVTAGRYDYLFGSGIVFDDTLDGVRLNLGSGDLTGALFYARAAAAANYAGTANSTLTAAELKWNATKELALTGAYMQFENSTDDKYKFADLAISYKLSPDWVLGGGYVESNASEEDQAYQVKLSYKGAAPAVEGTWGAWVAYRNVEANTTWISTIDNPSILASGFKGYEVGFDYAPWKNTKVKVYYNDGDSTTKGTDHEQNFFRAQMEVFF